MATQVQLRRGTAAQNDAFTGAVGEVTYDSDNDTLRVHDGGVAGGYVVTTNTGTQTLTNKTLTSPTINGGSMTGDLSFGDNDKAIFGAGSDFEIYHSSDGNTFLTESGSGSLFIQGTNIRLRNTDTLKTYALFVDGGAASLYYNDSEKLATTSTGIDVTGTVVADTLDVQGASSTVTGLSFLANTNGVNKAIDFQNTSGLKRVGFEFDNSTAQFSIVDRDGNKMFTVDEPTGDISFYEDTGTTPKFFWDASAESLGIGRTNPEGVLHVRQDQDGTTRAVIQNRSSTGTPVSELSFLTGTVDISDSRYAYIQSAGASSNYLAFGTGNGAAPTERMRIDSSGRVGIGTTSIGSPFVVSTSFNTGYLAQFVNTGTGSDANGVLIKGGVDVSDYTLRLQNQSGTEILAAKADGNVGIGTTSPAGPLEISNGTERHRVAFGTGEVYLMARNASAYITQEYIANQHVFTGYGDSSANEAMRIDSSGNLLVGKTTTTIAATGILMQPTGGVDATRDGVVVLSVNRLSSDGNLVAFLQDTVQEGTISVSGSTVSYNGGHLSRWSQTSDNTRINGLLKGTVMTNLDQMAVWGDEDNEQLNCMAVSSVEGDPNVAGVFVNWDNDDETYTADMNIAMTGDMIIRIAQGTTVQRGDLLMSAGDGTAKPQGDDIVRSKTIAKVTSTHVTCTYEDGSYCVPCVLMAC
jgi:hypothetical protein